MTTIGVAGVHALAIAYRLAIEHGTSLHVRHARDQVRDVLQATGIADVLADSDDLAALMLAVMDLDQPVYRIPTIECDILAVP